MANNEDDDQVQAEMLTRLFRANHKVAMNPVAQARPRLHRGRMYDPSRRLKLAFRQLVLQYLETTYGVTENMMPLTTSYVTVKLTFLIRRPQSHFVCGDRNRGFRPQYEDAMPTTTGDIDNYVKFVLDAIEGIFFGNDRNVVQVSAIKLYCNRRRGRVIFNICPFAMQTIVVNDEN